MLRARVRPIRSARASVIQRYEESQNHIDQDAGNDRGEERDPCQVATFYLAFFDENGQKLDAQVLDTALDFYATTTSLGGNAAQAYAFAVNAYGLGGSSWNVGSSGRAFGVANNTTLTIYALLEAVNSQAVNGALYGGDATLRNEAKNAFDGINQAEGL
jgi:hypothetical protein